MSGFAPLLALVALSACTRVHGHATYSLPVRIENGLVFAAEPPRWPTKPAWDEFLDDWYKECHYLGDIVVDRVTIQTEPALPLEEIFRDRVVFLSQRPIRIVIPPPAFTEDLEPVTIASGRNLRGLGPAALRVTHGPGSTQLPREVLVVKGPAAAGVERLMPFRIVITVYALGRGCGPSPPWHITYDPLIK